MIVGVRIEVRRVWDGGGRDRVEACQKRAEPRALRGMRGKGLRDKVAKDQEVCI
jgi:hypothetical protein